MLKKIILIIPIFIFSFALLSGSVFASTLHLSPSSSTVGVGSSMSVQVRLNTAGESVNGVSAYLSYPADKLDVAWISYGSSFSIAAEGAYGGGGIRISRGNISGVSGNLLIATIGFKGKAQGSATVSFIGGSAAPRASDSSDSLNLGGSSGGAYTVVQGSTSQTPATTGTPKQTQTDTTAPIISEIKVSAITRNSAKITWKTDKSSDSTVSYGIEKGKYLLEETNASLTNDHSIQLDAASLTPGAKIYFVVKAKDASGNIGTSQESTTQLLGNTVSVRFVDEKGAPLAQIPVTLYSEPQTVTTNNNGEAVFKNVTSGKHVVIAKLKNNTEKTHEINVADSDSVQPFTFKVSESGSSGPLSLLLIPLFLILAVIAGVFIWKKKHKITNFKPPTFPNSPFK